MEPDVERAKLCAEAIAEICKQYNCIIIPEVKLIGKEVVPSIHVVAQEVKIENEIKVD